MKKQKNKKPQPAFVFTCSEDDRFYKLDANGKPVPLNELKFVAGKTLPPLYTKEKVLEFGNFIWMKTSIHKIECEPLIEIFFNEWLEKQKSK